MTINEKKYDIIWKCIKGGASNDEILGGFGITEGTLDRIKRSKGDYQLFIKMRYKECLTGHKKKKQEGRKQEPTIKNEQSVTIIANQFMAEELKKQTEQLILINRKLAAILDDMYGIQTPENEKSE